MTAALLALALLAAGAPGGAEAEFAAGEAAFRAGDAAAAESRYRQALAIDPGHLRAMIRLATVVSWGDRLAESVSLHERALSMDPGNREARLGLARVTSWAGDFGRSIGLYEGLLAENPGDREAMLGLARAHAWAGHHEAARRQYLGILAADPKDVEARNGLAATLSWSGRLDDALALYEETLALAPGDREAQAGRARVLYWQGRTPEARAALDEALEAHPDYREAVKLDATMREAMRTVLSASAGVMHDSDRNAMTTQRVALTAAPTPATTAEASYDRFAATVSGADGARLDTLKGSGSLRLARDLTGMASLGFDQTKRSDFSKALHLTGSAGVGYRLNDRLSFSGSFSRETLAATARSLDRGVTLTALTLSAAYVPVARVSSRLTLQRANFTEQPDPDLDPNTRIRLGISRVHRNQRDLGALYVRWAVPAPRPRIGLSWSERYQSYDRATGNGYFAPRTYLASVAGVDVSDRLGPRIGWSLEGTLGAQRVAGFGGGADSDTVRGYHAAASYDFDAGVTVEAYVGRTNLALEAGSGFRSTESGVRLRWRIGAGGTR